MIFKELKETSVGWSKRARGTMVGDEREKQGSYHVRPCKSSIVRSLDFMISAIGSH